VLESVQRRCSPPSAPGRLATAGSRCWPVSPVRPGRAP